MSIAGQKLHRAVFWLNNELEMLWQKAIVALHERRQLNLPYLKVWKNHKKELSTDRQSAGRDTNPLTPEYETALLAPDRNSRHSPTTRFVACPLDLQQTSISNCGGHQHSAMERVLPRRCIKIRRHNYHKYTNIKCIRNMKHVMGLKYENTIHIYIYSMDP